MTGFLTSATPTEPVLSPNVWPTGAGRYAYLLTPPVGIPWTVVGCKPALPISSAVGVSGRSIQCDTSPMSQ